MKIYNYNKETKEFTTSTHATESPLEKGKYIIPANATIKEPLASKDGFAVCFNETKKEWEYIEDNRGKTVYSTSDKTESKISYLGVLKDGFTESIPGQFDKWVDGAWVEDTVLMNKYENSLLKANGEVYTLNGVDYQVPFMKDDADGLMQVNAAFQLGITETVIYFTNGTKMPITAAEFEAFAVWFVTKRNSFFVSE